MAHSIIVRQSLSGVVVAMLLTAFSALVGAINTSAALAADNTPPNVDGYYYFTRQPQRFKTTSDIREGFVCAPKGWRPGFRTLMDFRDSDRLAKIIRLGSCAVLIVRSNASVSILSQLAQRGYQPMGMPTAGDTADAAVAMRAAKQAFLKSCTTNTWATERYDCSCVSEEYERQFLAGKLRHTDTGAIHGEMGKGTLGCVDDSALKSMIENFCMGHQSTFNRPLSDTTKADICGCTAKTTLSKLSGSADLRDARLGALKVDSMVACEKQFK